MRDVFISGWCGYPELFGDFASEFDFIIPSITHSLRDIEDICEEGGRNLFAWSTGAYHVMDLRTRPAFENIVLVSPFMKFTKYTPERVLDKMIKRFVDYPDKVIEDFFKNCGSPVTPKMVEGHFHIMLNGLKLLVRSDVEVLMWDMQGVKLVHGTDDRIVSVEASRDIAWETEAELAEVDGGHWVSPDILRKFKI